MKPSNLARQHWAALRALLVLTVILGLAYPAFIWLVAQLPGLRDKADGSIIEAGGKPVGSSLIGQSFTDSDGNPLPQAPEWIANFTLRYGFPVGNGELFAYTDWAYRSEVNFFLYESTEFTGKELLEGGLRLGYTWSDGKYEAALFGRNITDEVVAVGAIDFDNLTGFLNEPQIWGVQFKATF